MKNKFRLLFISITLVSIKTIAQPFVDIANFSYQTFNADYIINNNYLNAYSPNGIGVSEAKNHTDDYFLNFFLPKEFKNGNTLLIRLNGEMLNSSISGTYTTSTLAIPYTTPFLSYTRNLYAVSMPLGFQFVSKNKKWKTLAMVVPKLASDFVEPVNEKDFQLGGIFIENYVPNEKVKIKLGLYYNHEAFGHFFMPLVGVDWKINKRLNLYGILPSNYKFEVNIIRNRLYTGLCFKSATRSFHQADIRNTTRDSSIYHSPAYVRYDEMEVKLFVDCFVYKKFLLFGEVGYSLGKNPLQFTDYSNYIIAQQNNYIDPVYTRTEQYMIFNVGIAYRIRKDFEEKKKEENEAVRKL